MLSLPRLRVLAAVARYGSVTAAAEALHYAQASVSHHLARLESETGAVLTQRVGRGIRLTEAGRLLAARAEEILGRLDTAEREVAALAGLAAGRVRLAAFPSALGTFVPAALGALAADVPGLDVSLVEAEPPAALRLLRSGEIDVAVVFGYPADSAATHTDPRATDPRGTDLPGTDPRGADLRGTESRGADLRGADARGAELRGTGLRGTELLVEPMWLISAESGGSELAAHRDARWIAGCERCRTDLLRRCDAAGFVPDIAFTTDDYVAVQRLVAAGVGVATLPGLALAAHRHPAVRAVRVPGWLRTVRAVSYGAPPDPPAVTALLAALVAAAAQSTVEVQSGLGSPTGVVVKPPPSSSSPGAGDESARILPAKRSASSRGE
jgi:DNA-binding transcriptional LysR family regulator